MGKRSKFRIVTGIIFLTIGVGLMGQVVAYTLVYVARTCDIAPYGGCQPKEIWLFRLPMVLCMLIPGIAFFKEGIGTLKNKPGRYGWAIMGAVFLLASILVYNFRIGNVAMATPLEYWRYPVVDMIAIGVGVLLLAFAVFVAHKNGRLRAVMPQRKWLAVVLLLCQVFLIFGWHRVATYVYVLQYCDSPCMRETPSDIVEFAEEWGDTPTKTFTYFPDPIFSDKDKTTISGYSITIPQTAVAEQIEFKRNKMTLKPYIVLLDPADSDKHIMFSCDPFACPERPEMLDFWDKHDEDGNRIENYHDALVNIANASTSDFSFWNTHYQNRRLLSLLDAKISRLCSIPTQSNQYSIYKTNNLMCISGGNLLPREWYDSNGKGIITTLFWQDKPFTPAEMKTIRNMIASIRIIKKPRIDSQEN